MLCVAFVSADDFLMKTSIRLDSEYMYCAFVEARAKQEAYDCVITCSIHVTRTAGTYQ